MSTQKPLRLRDIIPVDPTGGYLEDSDDVGYLASQAYKRRRKLEEDDIVPPSRRELALSKHAARLALAAELNNGDESLESKVKTSRDVSKRKREIQTIASSVLPQ